VFSIFLKFLPLAMDLGFLAPIGFAVRNGAGVYEIPFLDRMLIVFIMVVIGMVVMSTMARQDGSLKRMQIDRTLFRVDGGFALGSAVICVLLVAIYGLGW
jgi:SSS family solute:Na+ symporter